MYGIGSTPKWWPSAGGIVKYSSRYVCNPELGSKPSADFRCSRYVHVRCRFTSLQQRETFAYALLEREVALAHSDSAPLAHLRDSCMHYSCYLIASRMYLRPSSLRDMIHIRIMLDARCGRQCPVQLTLCTQSRARLEAKCRLSMLQIRSCEVPFHIP